MSDDVEIMKEENFLYSEITQKIIGAFYKVYNTLGYGFLEKVYENALVIELQQLGLSVCQQKGITVYYNNTPVGFYKTDLQVENCVIVENKAVESLCEEDEFQLINYLKATNIEIGLLLNFGKKPQFKRKIFSNKNKNII